MEGSSVTRRTSEEGSQKVIWSKADDFIFIWWKV